MSERKNTPPDQMGGSHPDRGPSAEDVRSHISDSSIHFKRYGVTLRSIPADVTVQVPDKACIVVPEFYELGDGSELILGDDSELKIL